MRLEEAAEKYSKDLFKQLNVVLPGKKLSIGEEEKAWKEGVVQYLKKKPLIFAITFLSDWRGRKSSGWAMEFAKITFSELEDHFLNVYKWDEVSEKERQIFKRKVFASFSESNLGKKLKKEGGEDCENVL